MRLIGLINTPEKHLWHGIFGFLSPLRALYPPINLDLDGEYCVDVKCKLSGQLGENWI